MQWRILIDSWNPNKYAVVRECSLSRLSLIVVLAALGSVAAFLLLLIPALVDSDSAVNTLTSKTDIALNASFSQSAPVYLVKNPDILVTTSEETGFITITPQGFSIKYFLFFGQKTYPWLLFSSLDTFPLQQAISTLAVLMLPSALVWGTAIIILNLVVFGFLYTLIAYFILHVREYRVHYGELWKVTLVAGIPSMTVFALTPILRLGLPIAIIIGFIFVLWLVLSMLGTTMVAHRETGRSSGKER